MDFNIPVWVLLAGGLLLPLAMLLLPPILSGIAGLAGRVEEATEQYEEYWQWRQVHSEPW